MMLGISQGFSQNCYYKQEAIAPTPLRKGGSHIPPFLRGVRGDLQEVKIRTMQIIDLCPDNLEAIQQAAALLVEGFQEHWSNAWPNLDTALEEVQESFVNLYPDVFEHIAKIRNLRGHPYEFYQKCGFVIVGVVPDANGLGKPDIYMAKRISADR